MKYKISSAILAGLIINAFTTTVALSDNLLVSSNAPTIWFDDSDYASTWYEWSLISNTEADGSVSYFALTDANASSNPIVIYKGISPAINHHAFLSDSYGNVTLMKDSLKLTNSLNAANAFVLDGNGDISFANGAAFIDKSENRIGIGTNTPSHELTLKSSSPTIKFIDTYANYNWAWYLDSDISANSFDISSDVSGSKKALFKLSDFGAGGHTYTLINSDYTGIGTSSFPKYTLEVNGSTYIHGELNTTKAITVNLEYDSDTNIQRAFKMSVNNTNPLKKSDVGFVIENLEENFSWQIRTMQDYHGFALNKEKSGGKELIITGLDEPDGMELILGNGAKNTGGQWLDASSRAYKENIKALDSKTAMEAFHKLEPVTYNYKTNKAEPIVGFIAEDVPDVVATNDRDALSALEMVALLTKVVQVQEKKMKIKDEEMKILKVNMQAKQQQQDKKIAKLETLLTNLTLDTSSLKKENISFNLK